MSFIGVVSDSKCFDIIKEKIKENDKENQFNLIHINSKSIDNIKNIRFEVLVVNCELEELKDYQSNLEKIYSNAKYLILNTDINKEEFEPNKHIQIITYGLNHML